MFFYAMSLKFSPLSVFLYILYIGMAEKIFFWLLLGEVKKGCTFAAAFETQEHTF